MVGIVGAATEVMAGRVGAAIVGAKDPGAGPRWAAPGAITAILLLDS